MYDASNVALRDLCARATSEADGAESRFVRGSQELGVGLAASYGLLSGSSVGASLRRGLARPPVPSADFAMVGVSRVMPFWGRTQRAIVRRGVRLLCQGRWDGAVSPATRTCARLNRSIAKSEKGSSLVIDYERRLTMGFGVVALVLTVAICAYGKHMCSLGRKADRERRHARDYR